MELDDDDVYFADLSKQISLLIADDEEDEEVLLPVIPHSFHPTSLPVHHQSYYHVPQYVMAPQCGFEMVYRKESKGTGVFIPRSSCPRRKNRSGNFNPNKSDNGHRRREKSGLNYNNGSSAVALKRHSNEVLEESVP